MAATLADVARRAGVSTATASRVLNNKMVMPISEATIRRIKQAAEELEYRPNAVARALVQRRTYTIGLFSREMTDPHFAQMLECVEIKARSMGYHLVVSGELEGIIGHGRVDGVIVLANPKDPLARRMGRDTRAVYVWSAHEEMSNCVSWNDEEGSYKAGRYLVELGHKRIAALFGDYDKAIRYGKVEGFRRAMHEGGVYWQEYRCPQITDMIDAGYHLGKRLLEDQAGITAIFARNDFLAVGAMKALQEHGVVIPDDVSIVGYTDTILARSTSPELTSVRTPIGQAGALAVERLVEVMEKGVIHFPGIMLPTSLTIRQSCSPPSHAQLTQDGRCVVREANSHTHSEGGQTKERA